MKVFFHDGAPKCLQYSSKLENLDEDVKNIFNKIIVYEKSANKVLNAEDMLDSFISVIIVDDESSMEKMKVFFARLREQRKNIGQCGTHEGYLAKINKLQKQSFEFKPRDVRNDA
jgi:Ribonuclease G/E